MKLALYKCRLLLLTYLYIQLSRILLYIIEICWSQLFFFQKFPTIIRDSSTRKIQEGLGEELCRKLTSYIDTYNWWQNKLRHFALNWAFLHFTDFKRGKYSFSSPIPSMQCCATVWATFRKQQTPQLWKERTREGCGFFCSLKLPYFSAMSQQFCHQL